MDKKKLKDIGLNSYESSAYEVILVNGTSEAKEIYKEGNIPFGKIYASLSKLLDIGLIGMQNSRPKKYYAKDIRLAFKNIMSRKKDEMEKDLEKIRGTLLFLEDEILKVQSKNKQKGIFWTTAVGLERVDLVKSIFLNAKKEVNLIAFEELIYDKSHLILKNISSISKEISRAIERGVKIKIIMREDSKNKSFFINMMKNNLKNFKEIEIRKKDTSSNFIISDNENIVLQVKSPIIEGDVLAMTKIIDPKLANQLKKKFDEIWESGNR